MLHTCACAHVSGSHEGVGQGVCLCTQRHLEVGWWPASPRAPPFYAPHDAGIVGVLGLKLRSQRPSHLCSPSNEFNYVEEILMFTSICEVRSLQSLYLTNWRKPQNCNPRQGQLLLSFVPGVCTGRTQYFVRYTIKTL